jgi:hypothetical protein
VLRDGDDKETSKNTDQQASTDRCLLYFFDLKFEDFECDLPVWLGQCSAGLWWAVLA